jgi:hypothetical protein
VALLVLAAHIAVILVIGRAARHAADVREVVFLPLPITPDEDREEAMRASELPVLPVPVDVSSSVPEPPPGEPQLEEDTAAPGSNLPREPAPSVDWFDEARRSAETLEQRRRAARERRSFSGPREGEGMPGLRKKPACPFEQCEPGWGAGPSVFEHSKRGRIEKTPDGEVIRWTSNHCYQVLVSPNEFHRSLNKCVKDLDKKAARGDLFDHMNDVPLPEEKGFDVP